MSEFGDRIKIAYIRPLRVRVEVDSSDVIEVASFIKETLLFDHAESVAGTDYPKGNYIEVVYHLGSYTRDELAAHVLACNLYKQRQFISSFISKYLQKC